MKKRIIGIDVARSLAIIGMIVVNFKVVFGANGLSWIESFANFFDGKASALFVVLAGVGLALMTNSAVKNNDQYKLKIVRKKILKRALFLFIIGTSYIAIWPADILHFYGIYMGIIALLLACRNRTIIALAIILILAFPILITFWNYETGWDFNTLEYQDLWTIKGFIRNIFLNGFHPVIPWVAFMLFGFWFGRQNLENDKFIKKTFWTSTLLFILIQIISFISIPLLSNNDPKSIKELADFFATSPMPPLPIYMLNGISIAFSLISACIIVANRFQNSLIITGLNKTGQLALTFYVAHVIIGIGVIEAINPNGLGHYSIEFSMIYALGFSLLCILFAIVWLRYNSSGPLEWVLRKLTN